MMSKVSLVILVFISLLSCVSEVKEEREIIQKSEEILEVKSKIIKDTTLLKETFKSKDILVNDYLLEEEEKIIKNYINLLELIK